MGSFHIINGARVTVRYPGQKRTCARCHQTAESCVGGGLATKCEQEGGDRVKLSDVMRHHWNYIQFSPDNFELEFEEDEEVEKVQEDVPIRTNHNQAFSPVVVRPPRTLAEVERYVG